MIKFLDRFGLDTTDIRQVFPDYAKLFDDVSRMQSKIREGVSTQAENEYISILESMDDFLMREENLQKFRNVLDIPMIVEKGGTDFTESEAIEYLEDEIYELEKNIPAEILKKQREKDSISQKPSEVKVDLSKRIERYDDRGGIKFKYIQFKESPFNRCLSMMGVGCKFLYRSFGDRNYILFPLNDEAKLIVETSTPVKEYQNIFGGSSDVMAYILCKNKNNVEKYYNILRSAFDEIESEPFIEIDDDSLFNNPPLIGAFIEDYLYQNADEIIQNKDNITDSRLIESLFSSYLPLQKILTLKICSTIYSNRAFLSEDFHHLTEEEQAANLLEIIKTYTFHFEGVGGIPHTLDILSELKQLKLVTDIYKPTKKGFALLSLNEKNLNPFFRASQYYVSDIESQFKKSKTKFSSMFGSDVLYHIKDSYINIPVAILLTPTQVKNWGFEKAKQINSFTTEYQEVISNYEYVEFLPFASESELDLNVSNTLRAEKLGYSKKKDLNQLNFQDTERYKLYIASSKTPEFTWAINAYNYNFLKKLYPKKTLRLFAPNIPNFNLDAQVFIKVVDENDKLIALVAPLSTQNKTPSVPKEYKRKFIDWRNEQMRKGIYSEITKEDFMESNNIPFQYDILEDYTEIRTEPNPVWDFEKTMNNIEKSYPDFVNQGEWVKDVGDLTPYSDSKPLEPMEEEKIPKVISPDEEYEEQVENQSKEPIVKNQEEINILQEDIEALQEIADGDEEILSEIKELEAKKQNLIDS